MIDTRALEVATRAQTLIEEHQKECADNSKAMMDEIKSVHTKIDSANLTNTKSNKELGDKVNAIVTRGLIYIISGMGVVLFYFVTRFGLTGVH